MARQAPLQFTFLPPLAVSLKLLFFNGGTCMFGSISSIAGECPLCPGLENSP